MSKLKGLKEKRAGLVKEADDLLEKMATPEADVVKINERITAIDGEVRALDATILVAERREAEQARENADQQAAPATPVGGVHGAADTGGGEAGAQRRLKSAFRLTRATERLTSGLALDGAEGELHQEGRKQARESKIPEAGMGNLTLPDFAVFQRGANDEIERRDLQATVTGSFGNTVQTSVGELIEFLEPRLTVLGMGAQLLTGLQDNLLLPRSNAQAAAFWAGTENASASAMTNTSDDVSFAPKRITAYDKLSKQLAIQSRVSIENMLRRRINRAVMNTLEQGLITGTGSSGQPTGLLNVAGLNSVALGTNGAIPAWANIVQMETEVAIDNADLGKLGYLFTPGAAGLLKTVKRDVAGNGFIWEGPNQMATVNGYQAKATNFLPKNLTKGASSGICHAALFGNFEDFLIGQWGGIDLTIDNFSDQLDAKVRFIVHAWYNCLVQQPASFCKVTDILIS